jgi:hypothetical protein
MKHTRRRTNAIMPWFWLEVGLAVLSAGLFALTIFSRDWIEVVVPVDPDQHSGALEWAIAGATLLAAVAFTARARLRWTAARRLGHGQGQEA